MLNDISFVVNKGDKIALLARTVMRSLCCLTWLWVKWKQTQANILGVTTTQAYFPKDNSKYFDGVEMSLVDWLRQYSKDQDETYLRGFLGRMLFSGEEALKKASVLSGERKSAVCSQK